MVFLGWRGFRTRHLYYTDWCLDNADEARSNKCWHLRLVSLSAPCTIYLFHCTGMYCVSLSLHWHVLCISFTGHSTDNHQSGQQSVLDSISVSLFGNMMEKKRNTSTPQRRSQRTITNKQSLNCDIYSGVCVQSTPVRQESV